jgi:hypothetical protein
VRYWMEEVWARSASRRINSRALEIVRVTYAAVSISVGQKSRREVEKERGKEGRLPSVFDLLSAELGQSLVGLGDRA